MIDIAVYNKKNCFCMKHVAFTILLIILFAGQAEIIFAQPGSTIELPNKPKPYQDRTLPAEKTGNKGFTTARELYQDMVTHYNYYFNANNRLNTIIANAKAGFKDDYTAPLLSFYNYTLDVTAANKQDIDSVIYRCAEGVLLHDLRNDYIDDMYFLLGRAYFLRKDFDSSTNCFRYINYAWAPKDQGYDIPVGSNASATDGQFSVATKEKTSLIKKITARPPARNDALLALCRNYIETGNYIQASSLIEILRNDPNFPKRLQPQLNETIAYLSYKQNIYDSSAAHLIKALSNAQNNFEESRWEFLIGQMYQLSHDSARAIAYYDRCINKTPNPVMQVYANLNIIDLTGNNKGNVAQQRLDNLLKLAKKDKYTLYRDIIYYAAAKVEMQIKDTTEAAALLKKSIATSVNSPKQKSLSFLMLADITYEKHAYIAAHNYYDSISLGQITKQEDYDRAKLRQSALKIIAANLNAIHLEDSLQKIAAMPSAEREAFLKKLAKQLEKLQGAALLDQQNGFNSTAVSASTIPGLFNNSGASTWYFNNSSLRSTGFTGFRQAWGNRPNVDNWNLKSLVDKVAGAKASLSLGDSTKQTALSKQSLYNSLLNKIPLTPEMIKISNTNIAKALFGNGETFENQLENYPAALDSYNELNRRFGKNDLTEQTLFNESYCYIKVGNKPSADSCINALKTQYSKGKLTQALSNGALAQGSPTSDVNPATKEYDHIYSLFLSGSFDSANAEKTRADSTYGKTYWTPQLLFIEAIYYVSKREDSSAINRLHNLATLYPTSPLAERANTMIDVLKRRKQIESYLTSLQIKRNEDEAGPVVNLTSTKSVSTKKEIPKQDSVVNKPAITAAPVTTKDTTIAAPAIKTFTFNSDEPQYVLILLDSVASVFANEAGNAFNRYNMQYYYNQKITVTSTKLDSRYNLVLLGPFTSALTATQYIDKTKPLTAGKILPWLTPGKFSYLMISQSNLDLLKSNTDIEGYKKLLHKSLPQEF